MGHMVISYFQAVTNKEAWSAPEEKTTILDHYSPRKTLMLACVAGNYCSFFISNQ
ncbi:hypothetical protein BLL52_3091 [Rhodoferax antarcticus ANT.BR]|uniref:Uncharacterized protein n=1 Tax=Rhodoferax antarcticus ANT.BR TaxID=1111071 RepID=A0A1Q8YCL7_9BURK|nr:hypothetical protein BLL52_3091 [Rhodoferax antarcticus ANT.BR]